MQGEERWATRTSTDVVPEPGEQGRLVFGPGRRVSGEAQGQVEQRDEHGRAVGASAVEVG